MAIISHVPQEGRGRSDSAHMDVPATRARPSLPPRGIRPFAKKLADENMEGKLTGQRRFLRKPGLSLLSKHLRRPEAEKSGPEGLPWKGLLVLSYASTKRSFDGTQGCGIKRFTVSWLQRAPVSRCPQASETGRQLSLASQPLKVSPALCPLSLLLTFTLPRSRQLFHQPPSHKGWKEKVPRTPLLGTIPGHSGALLPTTLRILRTNQHRRFRIRRESMSVFSPCSSRAPKS